MIDKTDLTEDELLATVAHAGPWVTGLFTLEYFESELAKAQEKGYGARWGTQSDNSEEVPKNRVIFLGEK